MTTSRSALRVAVAHLVYDLLLGLVLLVGVPLCALRGAGWRAWLAGRLGRLPPGLPGGRPVWIHGASVGEVKAARPLVARLRERHPEQPLVLSAGTPTGFETARRAFPDAYVFLAPFDQRGIVRRVLRRIDPRLIVLLELEAWPAWMKLADDAGIPQVIVNGRLTERSARRYARIAWFLPEFDRLDLVAVQTAAHRERVVGLGVPAERVVVTGNLKHEAASAVSDVAGEHGAAGGRAGGGPAGSVAGAAAGAAGDGSQAGSSGRLAAELGLSGDLPVFVAGSTHDGEDEAVVEAWQAAGGGATSRLVLVTRHLERLGDIERILERRGVPWVRRTSLARGDGTAGAGAGARAGAAVATAADPGRVLLVDTMGELEALFGLADVVFLGGSLVPVGGHNVLEPAAAGVPVITGPHLETCRAEADLLVQAGHLEIVPDAAALGARLAALLADPARRATAGAAGRAVVAGLRGAAEADWAVIEERGLLA